MIIFHFLEIQHSHESEHVQAQAEARSLCRGKGLSTRLLMLVRCADSDTDSGPAAAQHGGSVTGTDASDALAQSTGMPLCVAQPRRTPRRD